MLKKIKKLYWAYSHKLYPSFFDLYFSKKPIIGYYGFLGDKNFGDEWVYEAAKALFPGCVVLPIQNQMTLEGLFLVKKMRNKIKGIIIGGGTLIGPRFWFNVFLDLKKNNIPVFVHGTGVHKDENFNKAWQQILDIHTLGGLRGPLSAENLLTQGKITLKVVGDAAFAMFENKKYDRNSKKVLINLGTHSPYQGEDIVRNVFTKFVEYLISKGFEPIFFPFHKSDLPHAEELKAKFPTLKILPIPSTYSETVVPFQECTFAIGERLHFTVMSLMSACPMLALNYAKKHWDLLQSIDALHLGIGAEEISIEKVVNTFENRNTQNLSLVSEKIKMYQSIQFAEATKFLQTIK